MDLRYIENYFPVSDVSGTYRIREISSLHKWWARSSLESSSAVIYSSLIPSSDDREIKESIIKLSGREETDVIETIATARANILKTFKSPPKVLDPYAGGGSIPFESLRLGCETYANEYNPLAVLIEKCLLEYPQKYGSKLSKDFLKWMNWVYLEVEKEVGKFYLDKDYDEEGPVVTSYLWARTIPCQNPACGAEIPLMRQLWLSRKKNKRIALVPQIINGQIVFEIKKEDEFPRDFSPAKGTVNRAIAECLVCGSMIQAHETRKLFKEGKSNSRMVAVSYTKNSGRSKYYRIPQEKDINLFEEAKELLNSKINEITALIGINPLPDEPIPQGMGVVSKALSVTNYGFETWGDLFNPRQQLVMVTFVKKINLAYTKMLSKGLDEEYSKVLVSYLALNLGRLKHIYSGLARWNPVTENVRDLFGRPAISLRWECGEINPFLGEMKFSHKIAKSILNASRISANICHISQSSATSLPFNDEFFDAVFADPPYYDNIPYSYLSDFFYVWLKRTVGSLYPDLFLTPLTPKKDEIIAHVMGKPNENSTKSFETKLKKSFQEIYRVLKPDGIFTVGYTYKTTEGWEMVVKSLLESGFIVTASWPLVTINKNRLRAQNAAVASSSIYIVARKKEKNDLAWIKDVKEEIREKLPKKLDQLFNENIRGSDFFIAGLGFGLGIYSKYQRILDNQGHEITIEKQWNYIRNFITDHILKSLLDFQTSHNLSPLSKFYLLWRWNYTETYVSYDDAQKLAQSAGINLNKEWNKGFIVKLGNNIVVQGPEKRDVKSLNGSIELIDILHNVCLLWKEGKTDDLNRVLKDSGYDKEETLYIVAQAISETIPNNNSEKKLIQGFLTSTNHSI